MPGICQLWLWTSENPDQEMTWDLKPSWTRFCRTIPPESGKKTDFGPLGPVLFLLVLSLVWHNDLDLCSPGQVLWCLDSQTPASAHSFWWSPSSRTDSSRYGCGFLWCPLSNRFASTQTFCSYVWMQHSVNNRLVWDRSSGACPPCEACWCPSSVTSAVFVVIYPDGDHGKAQETFVAISWSK